jgi:hypothetical protein
VGLFWHQRGSAVFPPKSFELLQPGYSTPHKIPNRNAWFEDDIPCMPPADMYMFDGICTHYRKAVMQPMIPK